VASQDRQPLAVHSQYLVRSSCALVAMEDEWKQFGGEVKY